MNKRLVIQVTSDIKRTLLRDFTYVFFTLAMPIGFFLMFTKIFNLGVPEAALPIFYKDTMMQMTTYSVMVSSLFSFSMILIEDRVRGVQKLIKISPLPEWKYYMSKICMQLLINIFLVFVIFLTGRIATGVQLNASEWLFSGIWILFTSLPIIALGSLVGLCNTTNAATMVANLIQFPMAILGGLWWPIDMLPEYIQKIAKILPTYYGASGAKLLAKGQIPSIQSMVVVSFYFMILMVLSIYLYKKRNVQK